MASDPPGWYRDPRRPGMRRYWDGNTWVDVDQVVEKKAGDHLVEDPAVAPPAPRGDSAFRLVAQRRPDPDGTAAPEVTPPVDGHETPHD